LNTANAANAANAAHRVAPALFAEPGDDLVVCNVRPLRFGGRHASIEMR